MLAACALCDSGELEPVDVEVIVHVGTPLSIGHRSAKFDLGAWNRHHASSDELGEAVLANTLRTRPGRWLKPDVSVFDLAIQDSARPGYVDRAAFESNAAVQAQIGAVYATQLQIYGV
jgi:hypothetical protein